MKEGEVISALNECPHCIGQNGPNAISRFARSGLWSHEPERFGEPKGFSFSQICFFFPAVHSTNEALESRSVQAVEHFSRTVATSSVLL